MKKNYLSVITIFSVLFILLSLQAEAKEVALVVKNASSLSGIHEQKIKTILSDSGYNVTLVDKNTVVNYSNYNLIVIAGRPAEEPSFKQLDSFVASLPVSQYPTIAVDSRYIVDFGWAGAVSSSYSTNAHSVYIVNNTYEITSGYSGPLAVHIPTGQTISLTTTDNTKTNLSGFRYYYCR